MPARSIFLIFFAGSLVFSSLHSTVEAKVGNRSVSYSYFQAECFMWVTVAESPSGPRGEVRLTGLYEQPRRKAFRISQAEFNEIWSTLNAPGVVKRIVRRDGKNENLGDCYIFDDGEQKFAVSIYSDSPAISKLATRLKGYGQSARDGMMYLIPWTEVTGGELIDFGIYELKPGGEVQLLKQSDVIPARPNTNFGIRYRVKGKPKGRETRIRVEVKHPKVVNPKTGTATTVEKSDAVIGIESLDYRGVKLAGWYVVPGQWEIRIFSGQTLLVKKAFEVTASN
jgi:hypothetical protein